MCVCVCVCVKLNPFAEHLKHYKPSTLHLRKKTRKKGYIEYKQMPMNKMEHKRVYAAFPYWCQLSSTHHHTLSRWNQVQSPWQWKLTKVN